MIGPQIFTALAFASALWFLGVYCTRGPSLGKTVVKTTAVAALAAVAWGLAAPPLLVVALALAALGDFCLSRDGERAFLGGLIAFAASHLAYIALFVASGAAVSLGVFGLILFGYAAGFGVILFRHAGALRWPVAGYVCIIATMGNLAVDLAEARPLVLMAAALFVLSDSVLGLEKFVLPQTHILRRLTPYAVWAFYWAAQFLFLAGFVGNPFA